MQVNHIDENTIRVRINKEELAQRGLKVLDLLGDKNKIQHFFYSILDEVDTDHTFTKNAPVTFQVMPNNGGLDLLITKVTANNKRNNLS
ncbi:MAG TPA: adaptor protein MecA, partial [Lactobacillus acetotolerans]|nr:adaptor protein MecA [Lactobacillus acetotolerans]